MNASKVAKWAARTIQWTLAILACCCGSWWGAWLVYDALEDGDEWPAYRPEGMSDDPEPR